LGWASIRLPRECAANMTASTPSRYSPRSAITLPGRQPVDGHRAARILGASTFAEAPPVPVAGVCAKAPAAPESKARPAPAPALVDRRQKLEVINTYMSYVLSGPAGVPNY
jgi:hypothetical protein